MANTRSFLPTSVLTFVRFTVSVLCVAFFCVSSVLADYNAASADLSSDWTVTNSNGVTLDGSVLNYAKHTGALTISSDPTFTLTNGAVFEQSGVITSNKKAIVVQGGGTLKITSASDLNSQTKGLWGFYFYDGSVVDTSGAGFMCLNGTSNNVRFYEDGELIVGTNMWTKTTTEIHAYAGANAKLTQSTAQGISDASGLNLSTAGTVTFNVEENATLTSTAKIYDEGSTGSIIKTGAGSLTLSGSLTYNVPTTVSAGTLLFSCDTLPKSVMTVSGGTLVLGTAGNSITALDGTSIKADGGAVRVDGNLNINSGVLTAQGDWTGNGAINVKTGTQLRINSSFSYPNDITLKGGILRNAKDVPEAAINAPVNVESDSTMQAGWSKVFSLNGALKGSGNITIPEDSGYVRFSGDASAYTGSLIVASKGKIRIGVHGTDTTNSKAFIGPNAITLNGGTIMNTNNNLTVNNDLILSSESYFQAGWEKNLTLSGSITGSGKFHVLSDSGWVIAATTCPDNSYTGSVHTDNDSNPYGLLRLGANNPFGDNADEARIWGTLDMYGYSQTFAGVANSDTTTSGKVKGTASSVLTLKLNKNASKVYGGVFEGALSLVLTGDGTGTQILKQAPAYTGNTTIEAGTLQLDAGGKLNNLSGAGKVSYGANSLTLYNSVDTTFSGSLSGSGDLAFTVNDKNAWIVMATTCDDSFTGKVRIYYDADSNGASQGRVRLGRDNAFGLNAGQADVYGMLDMNGYSQTFKGLNSDADKSPVYNNTETLSTLTLNTTDKDLTFRSSIQGNIALVITGTGTQTLNKAPEYTSSTTVESGTLVLSAGGSLNNLSGAGTLNYGEQALTLSNSQNSEFSGVISGSGAVTKTGEKTLKLSGVNTYTGETTVSEGTLLVPSSASLKTSQVTVTEGTFQTGANLDGVPVNIEGGTFVVGDTSASKEVYIGALTLTDGTISFNFNDSAYIDGDGYHSDADWLHVSSVSLSSGVIDLTFNGSGADWWNLIKTYEYGYSIIDGSFQDYDSFNNSANVTVSVNGTPSDKWTLTAASGGLYLFATGDEPGPGPGNVWYDASTSDIDLLDWTIDGTSKVGAMFTEGGDSATFSGNVALTGNGEFKIGTGQNLTLSKEVTGSGDLTKTGEGTLTLTQAPGYTGSTAVETGTLVLSAGGTLNNLSGAGTVDNSGKALTLNNTSNSEFSGVITGAGAVTKSGSGTLELSGENAYTGATTVSEGELVFSGSVLPVSAMSATGGALVIGTEGKDITVKRNSSIKASGGAVRVDGNLIFEAPGSGNVTCDGSWTGSGSITLDGGYIRVGTNFNTTTGINFNGGSILNNNNDAVLSSDLTITKDGSTMQAGWSKSLTHKGALKGSASLTVGSDSGWLIFSGNGSNYQGSLLVKGNMRIGVASTDSDASQYIGGKVINLNGGTIQNNNNNITVTNDLNVMTETGFKAGWSKSITLTGNVTGSAKLKLVSDSGWLILKTHSNGDAFTGPFQTGWASTSSRGQTRLAAEQPLGANAGVLYNYGYLDMNGFSQKFKGVVDDEANNKKGRIYNTTGTKSVVTFDITSQNLSYGGTIESNVELIVNASGEGTQTFTNGGSSFTGNATINGGTLRLTGKGSSGNSPIGLVSDTRYVYVNSGGELMFGNQDVLKNAHNYAPINFVVNGGKISNDGAFYNFLQNTTFKNGGQLYASDGHETWKAYKLLNVTVARNDDNTAGAPVLFSSDPSKPDATIAFGDISDVISAGNSVATINVAEITSANASVNDNVSDLVISSVIADPVYKTDGALKNASEIRKTGAGTMELTAANTMTGKTVISEGTIKLSGSGTLGSGAVENNGTLEFAHESDQSFSNAISGTGAVTKTGSGTLTISDNNYTYTGETTVSGGTLLVTSAASLATSKVTVASATSATFQTGANLNGIAFELGQGGTLVVGETSTSSEITIGSLTLSGGTISFDFNNSALVDSEGYNYDTDWLKVSSASMNSGIINLTFNSSSEEDWWNVISTYADGFPIITGAITNFESFNPSNVKVAVNGTTSSDWKLAATNNAILLVTANGDVPVEPWYFPNSDATLDSWTIDGADKQGVQFTDGDSMNASYGGDVTMNGDGEFNIGTGRTLTLDGVVSGAGNLEKTGAGTLTLSSGENTYSGNTKVSEGTLALTGDAIEANNSSIEITGDAVLEYNVPAGPDKSLNFAESETTVSGGKVIKTGEGKLKILATGEQFSAGDFAVEKGELDFKGEYNGDLFVESGATLSPGNSVGDLTVYGDVTIDGRATGLFEFSAYNEEDPALNQYDTLTIDGGEFVIQPNSIIKLFFEGNDADLWAAALDDTGYQLVSDDGFSILGDLSSRLDDISGLFGLEGRVDGLYLVLGAGSDPIEPGSGVPEPSTWALLVLGAAGLLFWRKRKNA
ncbi:MAG: autotransporter-associated beta strand repeat-containing protein [Thermoguttaceae bacterium]|nr:autotransporter-associated beta strand repeat-containing protein [Thermoguttaceae bacterium]